MQTSFHQVLERARERYADSPSRAVQLGTWFEDLMLRFFTKYPVYAEQFEKVWLWSQWPYRTYDKRTGHPHSAHDVGIDLVAKQRTDGRYVAIQCKCYQDEDTLSNAVLDKFFSALATTWETDRGPKDAFARGIIVATCYHTSDNFLLKCNNMQTPCELITLARLMGDYQDVDWGALEKGDMEITKKQLRPHQREAIDAVLKAFRDEGKERGKMIMACGTGKTFTSLRLAEEYTGGGHGCVLFLAPSIALVAQTLREWMAQTEVKMHPIAVCSDTQVGRADEYTDLSANDLPSPATTDPEKIGREYNKFKDTHLTVIFSTYQSLGKVKQAQQLGDLPEFDLAICDEAHRTATAGVRGGNKKKEMTAREGSECDFGMIHYQENVRCKRRLYMTATPKIFGERLHAKVRKRNAARQAGDDETEVLHDMSDPAIFGEELYSLRFSRAVRAGLLVDYKVLVLCVDENYVRKLLGLRLQEMAKEGDFQLVAEDVLETIKKKAGNKRTQEDREKEDEAELLALAVKMVGCFNGLRKYVVTAADESMADKLGISVEEYNRRRRQFLDWAEDPAYDFLLTDPKPMRRAVAFCRRIKESKNYVKLWDLLAETIRQSDPKGMSPFPSEMRHVDGSMNMGEREREMGWLRDTDSDECRILTNVQCLSEGVDVPALDAIMFLAPKQSQIDIVQSVGRVMRRDPEGKKKFGYVLIPICIPNGATAEEVLDNDERYKVVWDVLRALRAHDDRFEAEINALDLNQHKSKHIAIVGSGGTGDSKESGRSVVNLRQFVKNVENLRDATFSRAVTHVGRRIYWENWAKNIADVSVRCKQSIKDLLDKGDPECAQRFEAFLSGLKENIRPDIEEKDAVEMLAMQYVTRPVFNALFGKYEFAEKNPVSITMNRMLDYVEQRISMQDRVLMRDFFEDVRSRAGAISTTEGRQQVIKEIYNNFFQRAYKDIVDAYGIVYTPVEVVDFIVRSVHWVLQESFGIEKGLGAEGVRILDPFTGTGTFIVRTIESGLIAKEDLPRKYREELFAADIVLLAYYVACVNIEVAYHGTLGEGAEYEPFGGICLTDTFRMRENSGKDRDLFPQFEENGERVKRLCKQDIRVIFGNPPYRAGQRDANDNNPSAKYPSLAARVAETYAAGSDAGLKKSLRDSYILAFRWASDRIKGDGVVAFVTNGSYIDNASMAGFRECLMDEFADIYCFNLRGFLWGKLGEAARREGENIFNVKVGVCLIVLVKKKGHTGRATLHYRDIGDSLKRGQKLQILKDTEDIGRVEWETLEPDEHGDWLNHRTGGGYKLFMSIGNKDAKGKEQANILFSTISLGVLTSRDAWCYQFSRAILEKNIRGSIDFFNEQSDAYRGHSDVAVDDFITLDKTKFSWDRRQKRDIALGRHYAYSDAGLRTGLYRPFCRQHLYFDRTLNNCIYQQHKLFPSPKHTNVVIQATGVGAETPFSCLISQDICDYELVSKGHCFPLYWYEVRDDGVGVLPLGVGEGLRHDGITDWALNDFQSVYPDRRIGKEDIFYYVYGLLHSEEYRSRYANNLSKELPRIPKVRDFWGYSSAGRELADWHLNYERVEPYPLEEVVHGEVNYRVEKEMRFVSVGKGELPDTIEYNDNINLKGIPPEAHEYIINGRSAIKWVMKCYQVKKDKKSGIINDPNAWCDEVGDPRYIIDLVKRVVRVSVETVRIVKSLPKYEEIKTL